MKEYIEKISYMIIILLVSNIVNSQKPIKKDLEKLNFKRAELLYSNQELREKESNIIRAKYNENYKGGIHDSPENIAKSYLKEKSLEFGISEDLDNIKIKNIQTTSGGKYVNFEQYLDNIPVFGSTATVTINNNNCVTFVTNNLKELNRTEKVLSKPKISSIDAINLAKNYLEIKGKILFDPKVELVYFDSKKGLELAWKINIIPTKPRGDWLVIISALDESIIHVEDIASYIDGEGSVYKTNPLQSANVNYGAEFYNGSFIDNSNETNERLDNEREEVELNDLTYENGKYKLKGPYCIIDDWDYPKAQYGHPELKIPELTNPYNFKFTRDSFAFEAVMAYYHIDLAARWYESLLSYLPSGLLEMIADPHGMDSDTNNNAYYNSENKITFGYGGVDGAEDAEIIWHEYGHAIQNHLGVPYAVQRGYEAMAVDEGTSDYFACSYTRSITDPQYNNWQKFADWKYHNEFQVEIKKRFVNRNWVYPDDFSTDPNLAASGHYNGQLWSSALMDVWTELDRETSDRLVLEAIICWGNAPSLLTAAAAVINADFSLNGGENVCTIIEKFYSKGLTDLEPGTETFRGHTFINRGVSGCDVILDNVNVTYNTMLHVTATRNVTFQGTFETGTNARLIIE